MELKAGIWECLMTRRNLCLLLVGLLLVPTTGTAGEAVVGFRGDGTGKYPDAKPPVIWSRISKAVAGLRYLSTAPGPTDSGKEMGDGVIRDWLILGPAEALPDEAGLAPQEGEAGGDARWRKVATDSGYLDFAQLLGKPDHKPACAFTRLYAPMAGTFRLDLTSVGPVRVYLNGKKSGSIGGRIKLDLSKGWNRLLIVVSPSESQWFIVPVLHGWGKGDYREKNIIWQTPLPGVMPAFYGGATGVGSPTIVGEKIYLQSEPNDLICLNKTDGKVLWVRRSSFFEAANQDEKQRPAYEKAKSVAEKIDAINTVIVAGTVSGAQLEDKAKLEKELAREMRNVNRAAYFTGTAPDAGFSGYTPVSDGQFIYAWYGNGVSACYSLAGVRKWIRVDQKEPVEHGFSSSPLLVDGKLVVFMRDLMAFDCRSGELVWKTRLVDEGGLNPGEFFHSSLVAAKLGTGWVILAGNGKMVRASDRRIVYSDPHRDPQSVASPVVEGKEIIRLTSGSMEMVVERLPDILSDALKPETRRISVDTASFPRYYMHWYLSSPIVHEGLAYLVNNAGVLTVVDVAAGKIVYQKMLDLDSFQTANEGAARGVGVSLALAGGKLYVFGNSGAGLVLEPGRTYRQLAKNKIENIVMLGHWSERQERFVANPVFDGDRLYVRGEGNLYCIGAN
jgi:outer membrane protein assembly factor BamB